MRSMWPILFAAWLSGCTDDVPPANQPVPPPARKTAPAKSAAAPKTRAVEKTAEKTAKTELPSLDQRPDTPPPDQKVDATIDDPEDPDSDLPELPGKTGN